jgi:hypothetical protein
MSPSPTQTQPPQRVITPSSPADIPYERAVPWYARRRNFYLIVFLLLLNVVATTSISWGPIAVKEFQSRLDARRAAKAKALADAQQAAALAAQEQARQAAFDRAMAFEFPSTLVCYTEDSAEAAKLLAGKGYSLIPWDVHPATGLPHAPVLWDAQPFIARTSPSGLVFLHGRTHPVRGLPRLITVAFHAQSHFPTGNGRADGRTSWASRAERTLWLAVTDPQGDHATLWAATLALTVPEAQNLRVLTDSTKRYAPTVEQPGAVLRLLAGVADPADTSRWTIPFTLDGRPGAIRCRLRDDDRIDVEVPDGKPTVNSFDGRRGEMTWVLHLP